MQELQGKQDELLSAIKAKEDEFGKKRAQFKELFLQKESKISKPKFLLLFFKNRMYFLITYILCRNRDSGVTFDSVILCFDALKYHCIMSL